MKKLLAPLVILAAALSLASVASAQAAGLSGGTPPQTVSPQTPAKVRPNRQKMVADALSKLSLTADQKAKIKALRDKNQDALKDIRKQVKAGTMQKADAAKKRQEMNKETTKSLKAILTKEQAKQFAASMKEAREKLKNAKGGPPAKVGGN